jgi:hypothetical protein
MRNHINNSKLHAPFGNYNIPSESPWKGGHFVLLQNIFMNGVDLRTIKQNEIPNILKLLAANKITFESALDEHAVVRQIINHR